MDLDADVIEHYGGDGLLAAIEAGLVASGRSPRVATVEDLAPVDEFHVGGRVATTELCDQLDVVAGQDVLDIGCGIGGTARLIASRSGCRVTGVDLNPTYVDIARTLTGWTGLSDQVRFEAGSALALPFDDDSFDRAVQLHVGMNIADKARLFAEIARVLRPAGRLAVYDIVRERTDPIPYPMPWAGDESQSFVADRAGYRHALEGAGFVVTERDRRRFAVDFFAAQSGGGASRSGPPPLGVHLIIGSDAPTKLGNLRNAIVDGVLAPMEFICELA
jgi:SAM-dependent methyltransferase